MSTQGRKVDGTRRLRVETKTPRDLEMTIPGCQELCFHDQVLVAWDPSLEYGGCVFTLHTGHTYKGDKSYVACQEGHSRVIGKTRDSGP